MILLTNFHLWLLLFTNYRQKMTLRWVMLTNMRTYTPHAQRKWVFRGNSISQKCGICVSFFHRNKCWFRAYKWITCTELSMVLRAKMVAQSLTVDSLSKAPCVSISRTATYDKWILNNSILIHYQLHTEFSKNKLKYGKCHSIKHY